MGTLSTLELSEIVKIPEAPRIRPVSSPYDLTDDDFQLEINQNWKRIKILGGKGRRRKRPIWKLNMKQNHHKTIKK